MTTIGSEGKTVLLRPMTESTNLEFLLPLNGAAFAKDALQIVMMSEKIEGGDEEGRHEHVAQQLVREHP